MALSERIRRLHSVCATLFTLCIVARAELEWETAYGESSAPSLTHRFNPGIGPVASQLTWEDATVLVLYAASIGSAYIHT